MRALIVEDGLSRQALAAARALSADGWSVGVGSPRLDRCVCAVSRAVSAWHPVPAAESSLSGFLEGVQAAVDAGRYDVVFGARDFDVAALSYHRKSIPAVIPYAANESVIEAQDKLALSKAATQAGFAVPEMKTRLDEALEAWPGEHIMVKPRVGEALAAGLREGRFPGRSAAVLARDADSARAAAEAIEKAGDMPLFQRPMRGHLGAVIVLADPESNVVFCAQQEAERTWPRGAGISVRARTIAVDQVIRERAQRLVSGLGWFGIAQLQLMRDGGADHLIDFNGRFYGSLALMLGGARANLPAAWARMALGESVPPLSDGIAGVRYQWLWGDVRRAMGDRQGGLVADLAGSLAYARGAAHSVSSLRDPKPAARYLGIQVRRRLGKAASAAAAREEGEGPS